jgi:hypothetical protein
MEMESKVRTRSSVTCYKSTDGKLFEDKKEFLAYQKDLDVKKNLELFFNNESVTNIVFENKEIILAILLNKQSK